MSHCSKNKRKSFTLEDMLEEKLKRPLMLVRVTDKEAKDIMEKGSMEKNPFVPAFYETVDTYMIDANLFIRMAYNNYHSCHYFYWARKGNKGTVSVICWSFYESLDLLEELEKFLRSCESRPRKPREVGQLIDYFGRIDSRAYEHNLRQWVSYWQSPDLALEHILVRFGHRRATNQYTLLIHSPVGADKPVGTCIGPVFYVSMPGMKMLRTYLEAMHREICFGKEGNDEEKEAGKDGEEGGEEEGEEEAGEDEEEIDGDEE